MNKKFTLTKDSTLLHKSKGYAKIFNTIWSAVLLLVLILPACEKDNFKGEVIGLCPVIVSTDPADKAVDVALNKVISVTFNTDMDSTSITKATFTITQGGAAVSGTVATTADDKVYTFKPDVPLLPFVVYTGTITTSATDRFKTAVVNNYVWNFTTMPQIVASSSPIAGGVTTGGGTFAQGSTTTVVATPNTGYTFVNWTDNGTSVSGSASYQFIVAGNRTLVANYALVAAGKFAVNLSSTPTAGGATNGSGSFNAGALVTVTATPNNGYTFVNWTENGTQVSTSTSYQFVLAGNRNLVANYKVITGSQIALALSSTPAAGGSTNGSGAYTVGTSVTATATPNIGYTFVNWTEAGNVVSTSAAYTFVLNANRTLVANFQINSYTLALSASPTAGGALTGAGPYNYGATATAVATANPGYTFVSWTEAGNIVSTSASYQFTVTANRTLVANFNSSTFTLNVTAVNGTVVENPNQATYNNGSTVQLTATANPGYTFTSWSGDAISVVNPLTVTMNANKNITANFTLNAPVGPVLIPLGLAGNYNMLTETGITTTGVTSIQGDLGVSPAAATSITGFGLIMDASGQFSKTPIVTGKVYAADYAAPTPTNLTVAIANMQTAFTNSNLLVVPAPVVDLYAGNPSGQTLPPGLYKWNTGVLITNAGITLNGGPNDTWVFQIKANLTVNDAAIVHLTGGAQAKNVYWVVSGQATLGSNDDFSGIILSQTLISLNVGTKVTGRLLAQTAVTLNANTIVLP